MKKITTGILIGVLAVCFCACSPASKKEVLRYAEREFGDAEYVRTEEIDEDAIRYFLCDEEYGFEYYVTSEVNDVLIDGAKFGESESKSSNFEKVYYNFVLEQIKDELTALEGEYSVRIVSGADKLGQLYRLAEVYCESGDASVAPQVTKAVKELFADYDTRGYWSERSIEVYDVQENSLGSYSFKYDRFLTPQDETDVFYYEQMQMLNSEAEYIRKEQKVFKEIGVSLDDLPTILGSEPVTEDSIITFYYFDIEGKEYYLADVLVYGEYGSIVWYTNYKEE